MIQILGAVIGGLHMVHEREDQKVCGPVMPQGKNKSITGLLLPKTIRVGYRYIIFPQIVSSPE